MSTDANGGQVEGGGKVTPPYLPYVTWKGFLGELKDTVIPTKIDSGVMRSKSGTDQTGIRTAMKFFGFTDDDGGVLDALRPIVEAHGTDEWAGVWKRAVQAAYAPLVAGVNLTAGTGNELAEAFRSRSTVTGSTTPKAIRFFLAALDDVGVPYSPHIKPPRVKRSGGRKKKVADAPTATPAPAAEEPKVPRSHGLVVPEGWRVQGFNLPGRPHPLQLVMPADMRAVEWKMLTAFAQVYTEAQEAALPVLADDDDEDED